ncbi:MAG: ATP synthase subunit I [Candidatus Aminicenantales bacterium]|jgi:hypothetical protein
MSENAPADGPVAPLADPIEEKIIRRIPFEVAAAAGLLAIPAVLLFSPLTGVFFLAGGLVSAVSFIWLKSALARVLAGDKAKAVRTGIALYAVRFLLIFGVFFLIILLYPKKLIAFVAGFSTVIPVFLGEAALALARLKSAAPWKS